MELERRVRALEQAVARLEADAAWPVGAALGETEPTGEQQPGSPSDETLWMVEKLRASGSAQGALGYAGAVELETGETFLWQWQRSGEHVLNLDWAAASATLDALSSPVRLRIVHAVLTGAATTAQLGELHGLGTTGQLHHHLRALVAAGWLHTPARGRYAVPAARVVPLLIIVMAGAE